MTASVQRAVAPDGTELHVVPHGPAQLPRVEKRDLEQAWDAAHDAARGGQHGPRRGFRFADGPDVLLGDRDARAWAASVDRIADLSTPRGISICLRLLGLVALIAEAKWLAPFIRIERGGAAIDGAVLGAAALTRLTDTGGLDEMAMRAILDQHPTKETNSCSA